MEMKQEHINKLAKLLADQAHVSGNSSVFFKSLVDNAGLPEEWPKELSSKWTGDANKDSKYIIKWALSKGDNDEDPRYSTLGSILRDCLEMVGNDLAREPAILILHYELYKDVALCRKIQEKYKIQDIEISNLSVSKNTDLIVSEQARKELSEILKKIVGGVEEQEEKLFLIRDACRNALPKSQRHYALSVNEIEAAIKFLDKYPPGEDGIPKILQFACYLAEITSGEDGEINSAVDAWFKVNNFKKPNSIHRNSCLRSESNEPPEPRLFIWVEEKMTEGFLKGDEQRFSAQAWLIPHFPCILPDREVAEEIYKSDEYYVLDLSYLLSIYKNEISKHISSGLLEKINETKLDDSVHVTKLSLSMEEIKELLSLFLSEAILLLTEEDPNNDKLNIGRLSIELFLPEKLLCFNNIDSWVAFNVIQEKEYLPVGATFMVLLHNLERFTKRQAKKSRLAAKKAQARDALQENAWKANWRLAMTKLENLLDSSDFEPIGADFDDKILQVKLENKIAAVLGQTSQRDELLKSVIVAAGIPIVLWTRYNELDADHLPEMRELVSKAALKDLPERVLRKRQEAIFNSQVQNHLGRHLVMLWDDPNRFPPSEDNLKFPA